MLKFSSFLLSIIKLMTVDDILHVCPRSPGVTSAHPGQPLPLPPDWGGGRQVDGWRVLVSWTELALAPPLLLVHLLEIVTKINTK